MFQKTWYCLDSKFASKTSHLNEYDMYLYLYNILHSWGGVSKIGTRITHHNFMEMVNWCYDMT